MHEPPATYGDVTGEYLALRTAAGLVAGSHDLVTLAGPDATSFLQGIVSQDVEALPPDGVARSFLLGPEGKLRALLWICKGTDRVLVLADPGRGPGVVEDLNRYRFRVRVDISPEVRTVDSLAGPEAAGQLAAAGLPAPSGWKGSGEAVVASIALGALPRFALAGVDGERLVAAGARRAGSLAYTAVRVEAGEPYMGTDVDEKTIPQETGLVAEAVSFTKGCYLGQELVARIDSRGHVNRMLRAVTIADNVLPPEGAELVDGESVVGSISSVAESLSLRAPVGLALVRTEVHPPREVTVRWPGGTCRGMIRTLPLSDFGGS